MTSPSETTLETPTGGLTGVVLVLTAALGFASKGIFIKLSYQVSGSIDAITVMALRMLMALPVYLISAVILHRRPNQVALRKGDYYGIFYLGFMGYYLSSFLDLSGLQQISAGLERLIIYLYPTFVVLISAYLARRRISRREGFALVLSYLGLALVFAFEFRHTRGSILEGGLLVMAAAVSYALFMIASHGMVRRIGAARTTAYSMSVAALLSICHYALAHGFANLRQAPNFYLYGAELALLGTILPSFLMNAGLHRIGASRTAILTSIGPIMTLGLAYEYLGEPLTPIQFAGTLLILAGVYIASRKAAGR